MAAISANLTVAPSQRAEVSHFDHGGGEVLIESCRVGAVGGDLRVGGAAAEELLIGVKKAFLVHQILEIRVVEENVGGDVERRKAVVTAQAGTLGFHRCCKLCVDARFVVYPSSE